VEMHQCQSDQRLKGESAEIMCRDLG
jgi:hypothetical protein